MEQETQKLTAWDRQLLIRDKNRPTVRDYIPRIFTDFYELHGDRGVGDDGALIGGICRLNGTPSCDLSDRHARRILRRGGGRAWTGRGDRPQHC